MHLYRPILFTEMDRKILLAQPLPCGTFWSAAGPQKRIALSNTASQIPAEMSENKNPSVDQNWRERKEQENAAEEESTSGEKSAEENGSQQK